MFQLVLKKRKVLNFSILCACFCFVSCSSSRLSNFTPGFDTTPFTDSFHGLVVFDPISGKILHNTNGNKYFIPASNVKIFTLYTSRKMLPKKSPVLHYYQRSDTTYIKGTGYPASMHPFFKDSTLISFLKNRQHITLLLPKSEIPRFGPGWAWEDYDTYFSPESNDFPLYGNVTTIYPKEDESIIPKIFKDSLFLGDKTLRREELHNLFYVSETSRDTLTVPYITSVGLTKQLLETNIEKEVLVTDQYPEEPKLTLSGLETDSIIKRMMYVSDNFLAEQLLLMSSSTLSDTLSTKKMISHILENDLKGLKNPPRWVDGSGLSRYNLFTPESIVQVLQKLYQENPEEVLFELFPSWDANGTIEVWKNDFGPRYVFAKSGAMGNTYNLSGYLKAKSGRILIFSCMNNHFRIPSSEVRKHIELILNTLRERY